MAITDLTGTKWQMPQTVNYFTEHVTYLLQGMVESEEIETGKPIELPMEGMLIGVNTRYYGIGVGKIASDALTIPSIGIDRSSSGHNTWVYYSRATLSVSATAPIVTITGGDDVTNPTVIEWLETNATQIVDPHTEDEYIDEIGLGVIRDWIKSKIFVAVYNSTTAQDIIAFLDAQKEPFAPIIIKRGNDYYTSILSVKQADNKVLLRCVGSSSGNYYIFNYTVTDETWSSNSQGFQKLMESGVDIKTFNNVPILGDGNLSAITMITDTQYQLHGYNVNGVKSGVLTISKVANGDPALLAWDPVNSREVFSAKLAQVEEYDVCVRDEAGSGNVVKIGEIKEGSTQYNLYQFYYRTDALPNATTGIYPFSNLLANYSIKDFVDATGMTDNGIFIGNGRTDNNNRLIVQQFSKNNKTITLRAYQDFSLQNALLKVIFIGNKNA